MKNRRSLISAIIVLLIALTATVVVFADELITTQLTSENTTISLDSETAIFNGKEIKPIPKVVYKKDKDSQSKTLVLDEDYSLSYENNKYPGKAKIIISGIKDYKGSVNKTFKIIPQKPKDCDRLFAWLCGYVVCKHSFPKWPKMQDPMRET